MSKNNKVISILSNFFFSNNVVYSMNTCFICDDLNPLNDLVPKVDYIQMIIFKDDYDNLNNKLN